MESKTRYVDIKSLLRLEFSTTTCEIKIQYNYKYIAKKQFTYSFMIKCAVVNVIELQTEFMITAIKKIMYT